MTYISRHLTVVTSIFFVFLIGMIIGIVLEDYSAVAKGSFIGLAADSGAGVLAGMALIIRRKFFNKSSE